MEPLLSRDCAEQHFGVWAIESQWFGGMVQAVRDGMVPPAVVEARAGDTGEADYMLDLQSGMAVVEITGQITRGQSSFGGASSVRARRAIRAAKADDDVNGIFLLMSSPGGTVDGTHELAEEVRKAEGEKPLVAHIEDLGASAGYWIVSPAREISVNPTGQVGSIGTFSVLVDASGKAEMEGLKVHVISTGPLKGSGVPGTPVSAEQIEARQQLVDDTNEFFLNAVAGGRGVPRATVAEWATGEVWIGSRALSMGLVDSVKTLEAAMEDFRAEMSSISAQREAVRRNARRRAEASIAIAAASVQPLDGQSREG